MITVAIAFLVFVMVFCLICSSLAKDIENMTDGVKKLTPRVNAAVQRFNERAKAYSDRVNRKVAEDKARREAAKALANHVTKPHKKAKP